METKSLPINILKLIGSLKKSVRQTMRYKGGTPFSIIRDLFIYWDSDKSGEMSATELLDCMNSLGVIITLAECDEVVQFYNGGTPNGEMKYAELLKDIQEGEPTLIEYVSESQELEQAQHELQFEQFQETFLEQPPVVTRFLEATREWVQKLLRDVGGTPDEHIRFLFKFYDFDYSSGLYADELMIAARRSIKLKMTDAQAREIVKYYDRKGLGQIHYESFLADVCIHVKPVLTFTELTPRRIEAAKKSLAKNPFIPRPFGAPPNKILEKFKRSCERALIAKVNKYGGSIPAWVRDAFVFWDPGYTRKIFKVEDLIGACLRIGVKLTQADADVLMACYDKFGNGQMHYDYLIQDLSAESPSILQDGKLVMDPSQTPTTRTPPMVQKVLNRLQNAAENLARQAKNVVTARDVLHGTFVRFDSSREGFIDPQNFKIVVRELRAKVNDTDLMSTVKWFDTSGKGHLDYNSLTVQIYGDDICTERLVLPRINENNKNFNALAKSLNESSFGSKIAELPFRHKVPEKLDGSVSLNIDSTGFGVSSSTVEKNLEVVESPSVKLARANLQRNKILSDKKKVEKRLASIDEQRKNVIELFKMQRIAKSSSQSLHSLKHSQSHK